MVNSLSGRLLDPPIDTWKIGGPDPVVALNGRPRIYLPLETVTLLSCFWEPRRNITICLRECTRFNHTRACQELRHTPPHPPRPMEAVC